MKFTDVSVDPTTGSQVGRAVFPTPRGLLLPGMYARAELVEGTRSNGLTVPIRAVSRDERGNPTALVVGQDRSEEHTSELQSLMRTSYAVFCLKKKILSSKRTRTKPIPHSSTLCEFYTTQIY